MTRIEVARCIAADPASLALLLAGPAARELWPDQAGDRPPGPVPVPPQRPLSAYEISVLAPQRSGVGFAAAVSVTCRDYLVARGRLGIEADGRSSGASVVRLVWSSIGTPTAERLRRRSAGFLDNLAAAAQARSSAA